MRRNAAALVMILAAAVGIYLLSTASPSPAPVPPPKTKPAPRPPDNPDPWRRRCPGPGPCPRLLCDTARPPRVGGPVSPDNTVKIVVGIDEIQRARNISSRGLGCCGSRSLEYAARLVGVSQLYDLPEMMRRDGISGGDNQQTIDRKMKKYAPDVPYFQDTGSTLDIIEALCSTQRVACVGYGGHDPHYSGHVDHCVCVVACDQAHDWVAILDNNYPELDQIVWMGCREFTSRWQECLGRWVYSLLVSRPGSLPHQGEKPALSWSGQREWHTFADDRDQFSLWIDGRQRGNYFRSADEFYPYLGPHKWGNCSAPPVAPPGWTDYPAVKSAAGLLNYGIAESMSRIICQTEINGQKVSREELLKAIGPAMVPQGQPFNLESALRKMWTQHQAAVVLFGMIALFMLLRGRNGDEA